MAFRIIGFLFCLISLVAEARWVTPDEASMMVIYENDNIKIDKTGKSEEIYEAKIKILNEQGRDNVASYRLFYNGDAQQMKVIEAYTIYNDQKYNVPVKSIEDKPRASAAQGFDQSRQILLSFPKAEIGAEIYFKYSLKTTKTALPNFYSNVVGIYNNSCVEKSHTKITSALPLFLENNDPNNVLKISQNDKDNGSIIEVELEKPICQEILSGSEEGAINDNKYIWVAISSMNNWQDFGKEIAAQYNKVINKPLPELLQTILEEAQKEKDEVAQINIVTSLINEKIRYMGNWSSINGAFFPRDLEEIVKLQEADCKEFSAATAAILNRLGFKAFPATVIRGEGAMSFVRKLPTFYDFNHVFVKVISKDGKIYWVDPTNSTSMAQGIYPDVADKMTLVLDEQNPQYERSANIDPNHAEISFVDELEFLSDKVIHTGDLTFKGETALSFAGIGLYRPEEAIRNQIFYLLSSENLSEKDKKMLQLPDLKSRIVKDLEIKYQYELDNELIKTNLNQAFKIYAGWSNILTNYVPDQLSDNYLGVLYTLRKKLVLKNSNIKSIEKLNYEIDSPWVNIKRTCSHNGNNSEIEIIATFKKNYITSEELGSDEYLAFKDSIEKNIKNVAVVLSK